MRSQLLTIILRIFALLPLPINHALGATLGWFTSRIPNPVRTTVMENLQRCLPQWSHEQRLELTRRCLQETGKTLTESGPIWCWPGDKALSLIVAIEGREAIDEALQQGRGLILATPHLGCWELAGLWTAAHLPMTTLYRPPRIKELENIIRNARQRLGAEYVPADNRGVRALFRALAENRVVGMLPDQDPRDNGGAFAPFFGVPAYTMTFLSRLARKTRAPVLFTYCERLPRGKGYILRFFKTDEIIGTGSLEESLAAMNRSVEMCIRRCPEQYQWSYKRFKTRPPEEATTG